jgi:hypothetical protein
VRGPRRKRKPAAQCQWKRPLTRNLRDERANSDLSPQAGRGKGRGHMRFLRKRGRGKKREPFPDVVYLAWHLE